MKPPVGGRRGTDLQSITRSFVLDLEHGLHARPCALLVKTLARSHCQVEVEANGQQANGRSIMGLMALAAARNTTITFRMTGQDAADAMNAVSQLFETRFEEAYHAPLVSSRVS